MGIYPLFSHPDGEPQQQDVAWQEVCVCLIPISDITLPTDPEWDEDAIEPEIEPTVEIPDFENAREDKNYWVVEITFITLHGERVVYYDIENMPSEDVIATVRAELTQQGGYQLQAITTADRTDGEGSDYTEYTYHYGRPVRLPI